MINRIELFFSSQKLSLDDEKTFITNKWVLDFLDEQSSAGVEFWLKDFKFSYKGKSFYFTHSVFSRLRKEDHQIFGKAYEIVSNDVLGKGGDGVVSDILYTISRNKNDYNFKNHCRVIKLFHDYNHHTNDPNKEFNIIKQIKGRGAKPPVSKKALIMKKMEGINWWDNSDLIDKLTQEEKKYLCITLLKAYQQQIYGIDLVHGDIKKGNILIKLDYEKPLKDRFTVTIVDFGHAFFKFDLNPPKSFSTSHDIKQLHGYCCSLWGKTELDQLIDFTTSLEDIIKNLEKAVLAPTEISMKYKKA